MPRAPWHQWRLQPSELPRGISRYKPTSRGKPRGIRPDTIECTLHCFQAMV
jgi:hypothetical protein